MHRFSHQPTRRHLSLCIYFSTTPQSPGSLHRWNWAASPISTRHPTTRQIRRKLQTGNASSHLKRHRVDPQRRNCQRNSSRGYHGLRRCHTRPATSQQRHQRRRSDAQVFQRHTLRHVVSAGLSTNSQHTAHRCRLRINITAARLDKSRHRCSLRRARHGTTTKACNQRTEAHLLRRCQVAVGRLSFFPHLLPLATHH